MSIMAYKITERGVLKGLVTEIINIVTEIITIRQI